MSTSEPAASPRLVGVVVGAVIAALVLAAFSLSVVSFGDKTYVAEFARSGGAKSGDEVRVAGVGVGRVTAVELAQDRVLVRFKLDGDVHLGAATRAEVKLATLLGNKYLEVTPEGRGSLPGDRIPLAQTKVTFDIQDAIESGGSALGKLDAAAMKQALGVMADAFRDTPKSVRATLDGLGRVSRTLASHKEDIAALIQDASTVVGTLQSRSGDIISLMRRSDLLLGELLRRQDALHTLITRTRSMASEISGLVGDNARTVGPLLARISEVTDMLEARSQDLDKALRVFGPGVRFYVNATGNGPFGNVVIPYLTPDNALCRAGVITGCE